MGGSRGGTGGLDPLENNKLLYVSMGHHGEAFGPLWFLKKISLIFIDRNSTCAASAERVTLTLD